MPLVLALGVAPGARAVDSDLDGFPDPSDNCVFEPNGQADSGGVNTYAPDGTGNACQCGDAMTDPWTASTSRPCARASPVRTPSPLGEPRSAPFMAGVRRRAACSTL